MQPVNCPEPLLPLETSHVLTEWKSAEVRAVYKKDSKELVASYQPISLQPIASKISKRCVYFTFYEHIVSLVNQSQHGFLRNRPGVSQLLSVLHTIGKDLDKNIQTDVWYHNLAVAFDSADHAILLRKLRCCNVTRSVLNWFGNACNGKNSTSCCGWCVIKVVASNLRCSTRERFGTLAICGFY